MRSTLGFTKLVEIRLVIIEVGEVVRRVGFDEQFLLFHTIDYVNFNGDAGIMTVCLMPDEMERALFPGYFLDPLKSFEKRIRTRPRIDRVPNHGR